MVLAPCASAMLGIAVPSIKAAMTAIDRVCRMMVSPAFLVMREFKPAVSDWSGF
jgi:hypothetical protein